MINLYRDRKYILLLSLVLWLNSCSDKPKVTYNGADLLQKKCASCHDLNIPPKLTDDEKAPAMMAVAFHIKDFIKVTTPSEKKPKFIAFVKDYAIKPSAEKSFCDKDSLKLYGVMPSQKGQVTDGELEAIAEYTFDHYDKEQYLVKMQERAKFDTLPKGEQIAIKSGCLVCHDKTKKKIAPSFKDISKKDIQEIKKVIKDGSKGTWKGYEKSMMPPYKKLSDIKIKTLADWIKTF